MIPDEDAVKPEGWLDEEPEELDDPGECWRGGRGRQEDSREPR